VLGVNALHFNSVKMREFLTCSHIFY